MAALAAAGYRAVAPFTRGYHPTEIPGDGEYDTDTLGARSARAHRRARRRARDPRRPRLGRDRGLRRGGAGPRAVSACSSRSRFRIRASIKPTPEARLDAAPLPHPARQGRGGEGRARTTSRTSTSCGSAGRQRGSPFRHETARVKEAFAQPGCLDAALAYYTRRSRRSCRSPCASNDQGARPSRSRASTTSSRPAPSRRRATASTRRTRSSRCRAATSCIASTRSTSRPSSCKALQQHEQRVRQ